MSTLLPRPTVEDWAGPYPPVQAPDGMVRFEDVGGGAVTLTVGDLMPGHTLTVSLDVSLSFYAGAQAVATIGSVPITGLVDQARQTLTATVTVGHELACTLSGFGDLTIWSVTLTDHADVPDQPTPGQVLALLAWLPIQGLAAFRLGASRLDRDALNAGRPPASIFILGRDRLGAVRLWEASATREWRDLLPVATAVSTTRGVDASGPILAAQAGTLTARAWDAWDPRTIGLHHGTEVRLIHWPTRARIFTGAVTDIQITPQKPDTRHRYETALTAADTVATIAGITRYGAKANGTAGQEAWPARIASLMASTNVPYQLVGTSTAVMCPTVWETSLAKHLDAACASVGGAWNVCPRGRAIIRAALPTDPPALALTDDQPTDLDAGVWSYTDIDAAWQASDAITAIEATTHLAVIGDDNAWQADDQTLTARSEATAYAWGGTSQTVDLTVPASDLAPAAARLLRAVPDTPAPSGATLVSAHPRGPAHRAHHMASAAALDVLQPLAITRQHETSQVLTTRVAHTITPRAWTSVLALTDRSTR